MKLTNNLLNNQNYILDDRKRDELSKFYYSIHKPHQGDTLGRAAVSFCGVFLVLLFLNTWIGKTFGDFFLIFSLPLSFFGCFYLTFKLWSIFRYIFLKKIYVIIFNSFYNRDQLEKIYMVSNSDQFAQDFFYKISVKYLKGINKIIEKHMIKYQTK